MRPARLQEGIKMEIVLSLLERPKPKSMRIGLHLVAHVYVDAGKFPQSENTR